MKGQSLSHMYILIIAAEAICHSAGVASDGSQAQVTNDTRICIDIRAEEPAASSSS